MGFNRCIPAVRKSDTLAAERRQALKAIDLWPDASFADARRLAADAQIDESRFIGGFWAYADPEGIEDEGRRAEAAAFREGR